MAPTIATRADTSPAAVLLRFDARKARIAVATAKLTLEQNPCSKQQQVSRSRLSQTAPKVKPRFTLGRAPTKAPAILKREPCLTLTNHLPPPSRRSPLAQQVKPRFTFSEAPIKAPAEKKRKCLSFIPTSIHAYLPSCLLPFIPTFTYIHLPSFIPTSIHTYLHPYSPTFLPN